MEVKTCPAEVCLFSLTVTPGNSSAAHFCLRVDNSASRNFLLRKRCLVFIRAYCLLLIPGHFPQVLLYSLPLSGTSQRLFFFPIKQVCFMHNSDYMPANHSTGLEMILLFPLCLSQGLGSLPELAQPQGGQTVYNDPWRCTDRDLQNRHHSLSITALAPCIVNEEE